jgi:CheY-like chemotaxis protein
MGGDVELVRSGRDGSVFRFTLAAPACAAPPRVVAEADSDRDSGRSFARCSVLIAEDDRTNQLIVKKLMQKLDIEPTIVADGLAAVDVAQARHFDLILMDLMMPELGGVEATKRIRALEGPCRDVPIVAFSAAAFDADREASKEAGMNGFIEKPARLETLRAMLQKHLPPHCGGDAGSPA